MRWTWNYSEMMQAQNATITADATVIVNRDVPVDSLIWLGHIDDLAGTAGPQDETLNGLYQVKSIMHGGDLKNRTSRRKLSVVRFRGNLPVGVG